MKSPMIQNRQKSLHILHEGPVYPESCEETWGMYEYQFHEVPIDPKSAKEPSCVSWRPCTSKNMGRDFMHVWTIVSWSPQWSKIRRRLQAFIYLWLHEVPIDPRSAEEPSFFFNNEGPIHPKSWEENFWACMKAPIDPTSAEEHPCFSWRPYPRKIMGRGFMHVSNVMSWSPCWSKISRWAFRLFIWSPCQSKI